MEPSEDSQSPGKETIRRGGSNFLTAGPASVSSPKSHQITAQKYQVTAFGRGAVRTRGASVGGSDGHLWHLRAGGTGKRNSGQRHSLKQETIMKRIAKQNERPP